MRAIPKSASFTAGGSPSLDEDVLRLEVAVDHAGRVGVDERVGERAPDEQRRARGSRSRPRLRTPAASGRGRTR